MIDDKTRQDLGWRRLVELLAERGATARGRALAIALAPLPEIGAARRRLREVGEARRLADDDARLGFGGIEDVAVALARAEKGGALEPPELLAIAHTGRGCLRLRQHIAERAELCPLLSERAAAIEDLGHVFHPILEAFDPDGRLADHASDRLGELRKLAARLRGKLEHRAREMVEDPRYEPHLQDKFWTQREDRYVLPIKVEAQWAVKGIVHGTSASKQTVFIEPDEIVDLNNQLKLAECDVADEEERILEQLTGYVAEETEGYRRAIEVAADLDLIAAAARLADDLAASEPELAPEGELELISARHPLMVLAGRPCVANDVVLAPRSILVISGPNAGGKTVALKTTGLAALMSLAGLHIAASSGSRLPWFSRVRTDIGDSQSLDKDLSTFSAHLLELSRYLREADGATLLLIDEVAVGTDPDQGAALAQAVLEALAERGARAMVTTHYERLKAVAADDPRFANASVGFDFEAMAPTFRLHLGTPGASGALHVARRLGLDGDVVRRAEELLGEGRARIDELLAAVAEAQKQIEGERRELERAQVEASKAKAAADLAREQSRQREREIHQGAHNEAVAALRDARLALERARATVDRRASKGKEVDLSRKRVDELGKKVTENAPPQDRLPGKPAAEQDLVPGVRVVVAHLGRTAVGEVAARPERGRVTVQIGALKTTVKVEDVRIDDRPSAQLAKSKPRSSSPSFRERPAERAPVDLVAADDGGRATVRSQDATLDVRGERADEALSALDRFIDESAMLGREVIWVIHGHGTGALRRAVREHLAGHRSVTKHRAGEQGEGGDGVTLAWLDT